MGGNGFLVLKQGGNDKSEEASAKAKATLSTLSEVHSAMSQRAVMHQLMELSDQVSQVSCFSYYSLLNDSGAPKLTLTLFSSRAKVLEWTTISYSKR